MEASSSSGWLLSSFFTALLALLTRYETCRTSSFDLCFLQLRQDPDNNINGLQFIAAAFQLHQTLMSLTKPAYCTLREFSKVDLIGIPSPFTISTPTMPLCELMRLMVSSTIETSAI